jgi:hypothetical protein
VPIPPNKARTTATIIVAFLTGDFDVPVGGRASEAVFAEPMAVSACGWAELKSEGRRRGSAGGGEVISATTSVIGLGSACGSGEAKGSSGRGAESVDGGLSTMEDGEEVSVGGGTGVVFPGAVESD